LFYVANDGKLMAVEIKAGVNIEAGAARLLFETHAQNLRYDVTADGQRFLATMLVRQAQVPSPITVVLNWQSALKK
jgi:hypothetical protein